MRNNDLTTFMLKKTWLYSPFAQKKFERTTFRNAKNNRRKLRGELILPSKRVALIRSCPVDHCFVFQHRCPLNGAFFISRYISFNPRVVQRMSPSQILRGELHSALSQSLPGSVSAEILRLREDATSHNFGSSTVSDKKNGR